jgi:hypothetical protein
MTLWVTALSKRSLFRPQAVRERHAEPRLRFTMLFTVSLCQR